MHDSSSDGEDGIFNPQYEANNDVPSMSSGFSSIAESERKTKQLIKIENVSTAVTCALNGIKREQSRNVMENVKTNSKQPIWSIPKKHLDIT